MKRIKPLTFCLNTPQTTVKSTRLTPALTFSLLFYLSNTIKLTVNMFSPRVVSLFTLFFSVMVASATPMSTSTDGLVARASVDHHGVATFYTPNGGTGACGSPIQNSDNAVALSTGEFQGGSLCGKKITVTDTSNGRSVSGVVIQDLCPGCQGRDGNKNNIDLTSGVFQKLDSLSVGVINVNWVFD